MQFTLMMIFSEFNTNGDFYKLKTEFPGSLFIILNDLFLRFSDWMLESWIIFLSALGELTSARLVNKIESIFFQDQ